MKSNFMNVRFFALVATILVAAACRLIPHPANFSPISAIALFGGTYFVSRSKFAAILLPLAALFLSDLVIGFHNQMPAVYLSFILVALIGFIINRKSAVQVAGAAVSGSVLFFLITNFSVWISGELYPRTGEGLVACFIAALPFFQNALVGDLFFSGVLFGGWAWLEKGVPALRASETAA